MPIARNYSAGNKSVVDKVNVKTDLRNCRYGSTVLNFAMSLVADIIFIVPTARNKLKFFLAAGFKKNPDMQENQFISKGPGLLSQILNVPSIFPDCLAPLYAKQVTEQPCLRDHPTQHLIMRAKVCICLFIKFEECKTPWCRSVSG